MYEYVCISWTYAKTTEIEKGKNVAYVSVETISVVEMDSYAPDAG